MIFLEIYIHNQDFQQVISKTLIAIEAVEEVAAVVEAVEAIEVDTMILLLLFQNLKDKKHMKIFKEKNNFYFLN